MSDELQVVLIAAAWSGGVGVLGLLVAWSLRHRSLRWITAGVAVVAVGAMTAGLVGTARAMFLSDHDFGVVLWVSLVAGVVALAVAMAVGEAFAHWSRSLREDARLLGDQGQLRVQRPGAGRVPGPVRRAGPDEPQAGGVPRARGAAGGVAT